MPTVEIQKTHIFYTSSGTGVPCLVMHGGLGLDHTYLRGLDMLGDVLHLVYYDHRHNGRSGRPPIESVTHAQLADDAESLRQHLGLGKVAVLGHSYGGFIALEYALRYPDSVSHLILVDTAPVFDYGEEIMNNAIAKGATPAMIERPASAPSRSRGRGRCRPAARGRSARGGRSARTRARAPPASGPVPCPRPAAARGR